MSVNVSKCQLDSIFQGFIIKLEKLSAGTASVCFFCRKCSLEGYTWTI